MGLFDFLTGSDDAERAAAANRAAAQDAFNRGQGYLGAYQGNALGAVNTGLAQATGALDTGLQNQVGAYNTALGNATQAGQAGIAAYQPLSALGQDYGRAVSSYYDALGLNGPGGVTRAQGQFQTGPGYQFAVDEATRAAANNASRLGITGSGNTLDEVRNRAQGFANQEYQNYLNRLQGFVAPQLQATQGAAQGIAGANQNLANIYQTGGQQLGGAYGANAAGLAGLYSGAGGDQANIYGNVLGGQIQGSQNLATGNMQANNLVAQAGSQDAANFWGLLGAGAKALGSFYGKPGG